jgi:hypothetical protein
MDDRDHPNFKRQRTDNEGEVSSLFPKMINSEVGAHQSNTVGRAQPLMEEAQGKVKSDSQWHAVLAALVSSSSSEKNDDKNQSPNAFSADRTTSCSADDLRTGSTGGRRPQPQKRKEPSQSHPSGYYGSYPYPNYNFESYPSTYPNSYPHPYPSPFPNQYPGPYHSMGAAPTAVPYMSAKPPVIEEEDKEAYMNEMGQSYGPYGPGGQWAPYTNNLSDPYVWWQQYQVC